MPIASATKAAVNVRPTFMTTRFAERTKAGAMYPRSLAILLRAFVLATFKVLAIFKAAQRGSLIAFETRRSAAIGSESCAGIELTANRTGALHHHVVNT